MKKVISAVEALSNRTGENIIVCRLAIKKAKGDLNKAELIVRGM